MGEGAGSDCCFSELAGCQQLSGSASRPLPRLPFDLGVLLQVGDALPSVVVFEGEPGNKVNLAELFKGKKGVLFGVPGAFTPGCSKVRPSPSKGLEVGSLELFLKSYV